MIILVIIMAVLCLAWSLLLLLGLWLLTEGKAQQDAFIRAALGGPLPQERKP